MKRYLSVNLLFTFCFLLIMTPLFYSLFNYISHNLVSAMPSKSVVTPLHMPLISVDRDFSEGEYAGQVAVLMYHQILPEEVLQDIHYNKLHELSRTIVTVEQFTEQMTYLKINDYTVLSLAEFHQFMTKNKKVPAKSVLITFDDGMKNVFEFAYPVLKKHGFYAVQFIIPSTITEKTVPFDASIVQHASLDELVRAADVFDYGNHTLSFHEMTADGTAYLLSKKRENVKEDIESANKWIGHSLAFAAPFGEYDESTLEILAELNTGMAFTIEAGFASPSNSIYEIPRMGIYPEHTLDTFSNIIDAHGVMNK